MIYLGIDPTAGRRPLNYAILDSKLNIVVEGSGATFGEPTFWATPRSVQIAARLRF